MSDERAIWDARDDIQQAAMLWAYEHGKVRSGFTNTLPDVHWSSLDILIKMRLFTRIDDYGNYRLTDLGRRVAEAGRDKCHEN